MMIACRTPGMAAISGVAALMLAGGFIALAPGAGMPAFGLSWLLFVLALQSALALAGDGAPGVAGGRRSMLVHFLPFQLTILVFTLAVLLTGGTKVYLAFMWAVFSGLAMASSRAVASPLVPRLGWAMLLSGLISSVLALHSYLDAQLLCAFHFGVLPLAAAFLFRKRPLEDQSTRRG